ncbi:MAG: sigma 54-interacting transcriptional regulator [Thermodesulfobacteriota bacterium]
MIKQKGAFLSPEDVLAALAEPLLALDAAGRVIFLNQAAAGLLDLQPGQVMGRDVIEVLTLAGLILLEPWPGACPPEGEYYFQGRSDLILKTTTIQKGGGLAGTACLFTIRPPNDESASLDSYKRLNVKLQAIFDSSMDGIWVCDNQAIVMNINRASELMSGIPEATMVGRKVTEIIDMGAFENSVTLEVLKTKSQVSMIQHAKWTGKTILSTGTPVFDEKGQIMMVVINERDITQLNAIKEQLEQTRQMGEKYKDELAELSMLELKKQEIVAESEEMRQVLRVALKLARLQASDILISGESGTGKGLLAKLIHQNSKRKDKPFIQINCAALPESLLEAELFGYDKGAFTGASERGKAGLIELAHEGTLFLDEIGEMPVGLQVKLLKYLDDHQVMRLGGVKAQTINCTIITATNRNLEQMVKQGRFRADLYYRLNIFAIRIPPLRERLEDTFELTRVFLAKYNQQYNLNKKLYSRGYELLRSYGYPGNVRELKNILKRTIVMSDKDILDEDIQDILAGGGTERPAGIEPEEREGGLSGEIGLVEKESLKQALRKCRTTREMARYLKVSQATVVRKLKKHGLGRH